MTENLVLRERFGVGDRTFAVLGEPWFDPNDGEWKGRLLFLPLDRSVPRALSTGPLRRSRRRGDLLAALEAMRDRDLRRAFRTLAIAPARQ